MFHQSIEKESDIGDHAGHQQQEQQQYHHRDHQQYHPNIGLELEYNYHKKSICNAYVLCIVGFLGTHHFYLGRYVFGFAYLMTFGLCGIGWVIDWFRMPCLVNQANQQLKEDLQRQYGQNELPGLAYTRKWTPHDKSLFDAYILWFPFGIFGYHHFYLRRPIFGVTYFLTFGLCGVGWLVDVFRMPFLVKKANSDIRKIRDSEPIAGIWDEEKRLDDAYTLSFPLGFLGLHHFYLNRIFFGFMYLFTFGLCGFGMVVDWFRLPCLVKRTNTEITEDKRDYRNLFDAYLCGFPLGFLGLHHFYLMNPGWGVTYFLTLGLCGIGWLIDLIRMPWLVKSANEHVEQRRHLFGSPRSRRRFYFSGHQGVINHAAPQGPPQSDPRIQHSYPQNNYYYPGSSTSSFESGRHYSQTTYPHHLQQPNMAHAYQGGAQPSSNHDLPPPYTEVDDQMEIGHNETGYNEDHPQATEQTQPTAPPYIKM